jgi:hypothetical protein
LRESGSSLGRMSFDRIIAIHKIIHNNTSDKRQSVKSLLSSFQIVDESSLSCFHLTILNKG